MNKYTKTLLEWDDRIPSFEEVHAEALKAKQYLVEARTAQAGKRQTASLAAR